MSEEPRRAPSPHNPVLLREVLGFLAPQSGEVHVDGTFGAGGYSRALLEAASCRVVAIDRDPEAQAPATALAAEYPARFSFLPGVFGDMDALLHGAGLERVDGIVLDIGVSSMQIDEAGRGFSFSHDGPLDMRMAQAGRSARDVVNEASEQELADIFYHLGEERAARRVAAEIVRTRAEQPIATTRQLAEIVRRAVRAWQGKKGGGTTEIDPATRSFQALRMHVNDELGELARGLAAAERMLAPKGRLVVVAFHSLEDRIIKQRFASITGKHPGVSRHAPATTETPAAPAEFIAVTRKVVTPTAEELRANPRARSARLRAVMRKGGE
jgi:16S rRNA (cytosine1402-N4)-methyltransferase